MYDYDGDDGDDDDVLFLPGLCVSKHDDDDGLDSKSP